MKIKVTAYEICVKVRLENVTYAGVTFLRKLQVNVRISQGIDNGSFAITLNIVRGFTEATSI
jgi:hypothetical protein